MFRFRSRVEPHYDKDIQIRINVGLELNGQLFSHKQPIINQTVFPSLNIQALKPVQRKLRPAADSKDLIGRVNHIADC